MKIESVEMLSDDAARVFTDEIDCVYLRLSYLRELPRERICAGEKVTEDEKNEIADAALAFAAERKAEDYLARCEQSRAGLTRKLLQKEYGKKYIEMALDYLENKKYLSDERYAASWLRMHCSTKLQGRTRLASELMARGISRQTAQQALDEFFADNDEEEICRRAFLKACRKKSGEKLIKFLADSGFPYKMITKVMSKTPEPDDEV